MGSIISMHPIYKNVGLNIEMYTCIYIPSTIFLYSYERDIWEGTHTDIYERECVCEWILISH